MNTEFILECLLKIFLSFLFGLLLGMERKFRLQVIGMRTLILISISSTLLSILSFNMTNLGLQPGGDPSRIASCVVSGIGFIGGGAIIHQGLNIKGLTSAAIIWSTAAMGLALGAGLYIQSAIVLAFILLSLIILEKVEEKFFPSESSKSIHLVYDDENVNLKQIKEILESKLFVVKDVNISRVMCNNQIILRYTVKAPREADVMQLCESLKAAGNLTEFSVTD